MALYYEKGKKFPYVSVGRVVVCEWLWSGG